jgi:thiol-disulfide isomerase/thioredoxin
MNRRSSRASHAFLAAALLLASLRNASAVSKVAMVVAPGDTAPQIAAPALEGWKFRSDWSQAAYTVVNFWATWCEPCKSEIPVLEELQTKFKSRRLAVIGALIDDATDDKAKSFVADLGMTYRVVRVSADTANLWGGINILPTTYVINAKGRVLKRYVGATPEQIALMRTDIEELFANVAEPAPAKGR